MSLAEWLSGAGDRFMANVENAGPQGLGALGAAIASAPRNQWGVGLAQGLAGFKQAATTNQKKKALTEALGASGMSPLQKILAEQYPELAAKAAFEEKEKTGPFPGHGFEAAVANTLVRGANDPEFQKTAEYKLAKADWEKIQMLPGATGETLMFKRQLPGFGPVAAPTPPPPSKSRPTAAPANVPRDSPEVFYDPANHPKAYPGGEQFVPTNQAGAAINMPGASISVVPGTGAKAGEGEVKDIREQVNSVIPGLESALNKYESSLDATTGWDRTKGPLGGAKMATLKTYHTNALLQAKELYRLGVLNGPDYQLMLQMLDDPESTTALMRGKSGLKAQIVAFRDILKSALDKYRARGESLGVRGLSPSAPDAKNDPMGIR